MSTNELGPVSPARSSSSSSSISIVISATPRHRKLVQPNRPHEGATKGQRREMFRWLKLHPGANKKDYLAQHPNAFGKLANNAENDNGKTIPAPVQDDAQMESEGGEEEAGGSSPGSNAPLPAHGNVAAVKPRRGAGVSKRQARKMRRERTAAANSLKTKVEMLESRLVQMREQEVVIEREREKELEERVKREVDAALEGIRREMREMKEAMQWRLVERE